MKLARLTYDMKKYGDIEVIWFDNHPWVTATEITQMLNVTQQNVSYHISNLKELGQLQEGKHLRTFPVIRQEGARQVTRQIQCCNEEGVMLIAFRTNSPQALAFQKWAAQTLLKLKRDGVVYDNDDATKRLSHLLDTLGVPSFPAGGFLARITHLAGQAVAARKKMNTTITTTNQPQNIIALAHVHLDEVGCPAFTQSNEVERLAARCTYLAALAGKRLKAAKALLPAPEPNWELIAHDTLSILRNLLDAGEIALEHEDGFICEGAPVPAIGFFHSGYKGEGIALYPNAVFKLICSAFAREWKHIPHHHTIWRALMKTGHLARLGTEQGRMPWLVRIAHPVTKAYHRVILLNDFLEG